MEYSTRAKKAFPVVVSALLTGIASQSASAVTVNVDGDLTDMITASTQLFNSASDSDPVGADLASDGTPVITEMNGFDITNMYAHYDVATDTFFLGMSMYGDVGTSGGDEGGIYAFLLPDPNGAAGLFDGNETYGFGISIEGSKAYDLRLTGDSSTGGEVVANEVNPYGASSVWSVSESNNGVEFSLTGLASQLGAFSYINPTSVDIDFYAGSVSNPGAEDWGQLNVQVVPVPAAVWLFGSGMLGLVAAGRRRKQ